MNISILINIWQAAKALEKQAIKDRRKAEDDMVKALEIPKNLDGTKNFIFNEVKLSIVGRIDRKVDSAKLFDLATEHGLDEHLSDLFRWKPEINAASWSSASEDITKLLLPAITSKPGRPSFTIITKEK